MRSEYSNDVEFVLVYVVDPHPLAPDLSPYSGAVWQLGFSKFRQPRTFGERLNNANNVSTEGVFDVKLADGLLTSSGDGLRSSSSNGEEVDVAADGSAPLHRARRSNALWCSWGPAPNAAWLIRPNGTVLLAQTWFDATEVNATLRKLLR